MREVKLGPRLILRSLATQYSAGNPRRSFDGLNTTLAQVEAFHPPAVVDALFRGLLTRDGKTAVHYAATLAFVHGNAESAFDCSMRPLFLEFNTTSDAERVAALRKLCEVLGEGGDVWLARVREV